MPEWAMWIIAMYVLASVVAFAAYGIDKRAAQRGGWRVPESALHFWSLIGGFPGAYVGQRLFRHKNRKRRFLIVFWLTVLLHGLGWAIYLTAPWR